MDELRLDLSAVGRTVDRRGRSNAFLSTMKKTSWKRHQRKKKRRPRYLEVPPLMIVIPPNRNRSLRIKRLMEDVSGDQRFDSSSNYSSDSTSPPYSGSESGSRPLSPRSPRSQPIHAVKTRDGVAYVSSHLIRILYERLDFVEQHLEVEVIIMLDYFVVNSGRINLMRKFHSKFSPWKVVEFHRLVQLITLMDEVKAINFRNLLKELTLHVVDSECTRVYEELKNNFFLDTIDRLESVTCALEMLAGSFDSDKLKRVIKDEGDAVLRNKEVPDFEAAVALALTIVGKKYLPKLSAVAILGLHIMFDLTGGLIPASLIIDPLERIRDM